ncbi:CRISPR-associated helicase Cas3' [Exiguobacterium sp. s193]|uniref:CRISPR-associated helicase Cas3' n=1 Tax=Exiguobacterium sp. s193 TaxID=2751207 RepID=UPI001BEAEB10|nr:CRISPR-associated helicase Cas3' [Exiguobacterium sp. s193]
MRYIAHVRSTDAEIQEVTTHLLEARELAENWGKDVGLMHVCGIAGLLHDMGKLSDEFQTYIRKATSGERVRRGEVDHATAGGRLLFERLKGERGQLLAEMVANAILSHHGNLQDYYLEEESPFLQRVERKELPSYETCRKRFFQVVIDEQEFDRYVEQAVDELYSWILREGRSTARVSLATKYIFSVLLDADRTNTREFEQGTTTATTQVDFEELKRRLEAHLSTFSQQTELTPINRLRQEMSDACRAFADHPSGVYTLSIPTGGGKTLASLRYALHHATTHQKKRIIYVVPFTTIIEQNAQVARDVLGTDMILEHHSNVVEIEGASDDVMDIQAKLHLAKDNWDAPIIFTTMVQYLNTFYAKGNRNTRRLHHLSEAVIIFDEVQKVPLKCISLFNESVTFLKDSLQSSVVLCTATQPALDFVKYQLIQDGEMIDALPQVMEAFRRTDLEVIEGEMDTARLADVVTRQAEEKNSVLVILNTKSVVKQLYEALREQHPNEEVIHLSTAMCAAHRTKILQTINERLEQGERIICISTQLIEAGVDVSFACVIRSLAGLDSIAQAAGRCNRHGEVARRTVYLIDHAEENLKYLPEIARGKEIVRALLVDFLRDGKSYEGNLLGTAAMTRYFQELYDASEVELDFPVRGKTLTLAPLLFKSRNVPELMLSSRHRTVADQFKVIEDMTETVLVPYGEEGKRLIAFLNGEADWEDMRKWLKQAQQYSINLHTHERKKLEETQGLHVILDGAVLVLSERAYDEHYGLNLEQDSILEEKIL